MTFLRKRTATQSLSPRSKELKFEFLEQRRLLAIVWANEFVTDPLSPDFPDFGIYNDNEPIARALMNRAIDDWNEVILDQNYDNDGDPETNGDFELTIIAQPLLGGLRGAARTDSFTDGGDGQEGWTVAVPLTGSLEMDDDADGEGWYFDPTPLDDAEFSAIGGAFESSFIDAPATGQSGTLDFYRVALHEIGHTLGIITGSQGEYPGGHTESFFHSISPKRYAGT